MGGVYVDRAVEQASARSPHVTMRFSIGCGRLDEKSRGSRCLEPLMPDKINYSFTTFWACNPLGPLATSNSTLSPSLSDLNPPP